MASVAKNVSLNLGIISSLVRVESARYGDEYLSNACVANGHAPALVTRPLTCPTCEGPTHMGNTIKVQKMGDGTLLPVEAAEVATVDDAAQFKGVINLMPYSVQDVLMHTGQGDKLYYLTTMNNESNYALIADVIKRFENKMFVARYTVRSKASLFTASVKGSCILLAERTFSESLKPLPSHPAEPNAAFVDLALSMVDQMTEEFDPDTFSDTYKRGLDALVAAKAGTPFTENVTKEMLNRALLEYRNRKNADLSIEETV